MPFDIAKDVQAIKSAILKSRYVAARLANAEMLKLYFAIGAYVSRNSREGRWGTGAIDEISRLLQKELPGLRGFSATNMRNMRIFFEAWSSPTVFYQPLADELSLVNLDHGVLPSSKPEIEIRQSLTGEMGTVNASAFMSIGFTHHIEIIHACSSVDERLFYVRKCAAEFWSVRTLRNHLKADDYSCRTSINPFDRSLMARKKYSMKYLRMTNRRRAAPHNRFPDKPFCMIP